MKIKKKELKKSKGVKKEKNVNQKGITLIALVITMILHYDEFIECSNNRRFSFLNI